MFFYPDNLTDLLLVPAIMCRLGEEMMAVECTQSIIVIVVYSEI